MTAGAPLGPWLVTADQVDGDNLKIELKVNGETRQSSNTSDMVFGCKKLVSYISKHMTLKPGDIIFTRHAGGGDLGNAEGQAGLGENRGQGHHLDRGRGGAILPTQPAASPGYGAGFTP